MLVLRDVQIRQLEGKLSDMQRNKTELEEEINQLQLEMEKQQNNLKEELKMIQQDKQRMEEEMEVKVDEETSKAHSAEVDELSVRIAELERSLERSEQSAKTNAEGTREMYESQLEKLRLSLETAMRNSEQREVEVKESYESQASELVQKVVDEQNQRRDVCESLQQQLDSTTTQLTESKNNIERLGQELTSKQSEIETLDVSLRSDWQISMHQSQHMLHGVCCV